MAYVLIDWLEAHQEFLVRPARGDVTHFRTAIEALDEALALSQRVRVNDRMDGRRLTELTAAAIHRKVTIYDLHGGPLVSTPAPEAKVGYITRAELGAILPEGWFIEVQLNKYSACCGEMITLPARATCAAAISDIQEFLSLSIRQANDDLAASVRAQRQRAELEQQSFLVSSDSPKGAVEHSTELDTIAP